MARRGGRTDPEAEEPRFRTFQGERDYFELSMVMNASWKADDVKWTQTPKELGLYYKRSRGFDPKNSFFLAEAGGRLVGCSYLGWRTKPGDKRAYFLEAHVVPEWRNGGLRKTLLGLAEERARRLATHHNACEKFLETWCNFYDNDWKRLLESSGYRVASHVFNMTNTHLDAVREHPLPPGIEVRDFRQEDLRKIWEATREALRDEPNYSDQYWTESSFRDFQKADTYMPHMWKIAWEGTQVVGGVHNYIDPKDFELFGKKWAHTERIFVRRPWRRMGAAKALISRSLTALREAGMEGAMLTVDMENPSGAMGLYQRMGYEIIEHFAFYRKDLA